MKEKLKKIISYIIFIIVLLYGIYALLRCILYIVLDIISEIVYFIKNFSKDLLFETFESIFLTIIVIGISFLIIYLWTKRDDIFFYITFILTIPYLYVYEQKQKKLQEYRDDLEELSECVNFFSNENLNNVTKEEFYWFVEKINKQNERNIKNKKNYNKICNFFNLIIQIFILMCGVLFSIFIDK